MTGSGDAIGITESVISAGMNESAGASRNSALFAAPGSAAERMERWREAGGRVEIGRTALLKGQRRVEATGELGLDGAHRVQGVLRASANRLDGLVGALGGGVLGALGRGQGAQNPAQAGQPALNPLPPLRFDNGRLYLGPLPVPGVRLSPLY